MRAHGFRLLVECIDKIFHYINTRDTSCNERSRLLFWQFLHVVLSIHSVQHIQPHL